jgi:hypothetical protein
MTDVHPLDLPAALKRAEAPKPLVGAPNGNANDAKPAPSADANKPNGDRLSKKAAKAKPAKAKRAAAPKATKPTGREGLIAVADLAKEYKLTPPQARAKLRAAKLKKPTLTGWAFPSGSPELKRVREVLKAK